MSKIVIVNDFLLGGGVENVLHTLVEFLAKKNYDITIIALKGTKEDFKELYPNSVKFKSLSKFYKNHMRFTPQWLFARLLRPFFKYLVRLYKYDIAIAMKEGESTQLVANFNASQKIGWIHVDYNNLYWTKNVFGSPEKEYECVEKFDHVICVSNAAKESFIDVIGDTKNLIVKYNPIDVNKIIEDSMQNKNFYKESMIPRFVAVGRLTSLKRYDELLKICKRLNNFYNYDLWIIGEGEDREALELFIKQNEMHNVILWGQQDNPYVFVRNADWFISTSKTESYGLAIQEALVLGTPVMAMRCPAIDESVNEEHAILVEDDFEQLYNKLDTVLKDNAMSKIYKKRIAHHYNHNELYTKRLEDIEQVWIKK